MLKAQAYGNGRFQLVYKNNEINATAYKSFRAKGKVVLESGNYNIFVGLCIYGISPSGATPVANTSERATYSVSQKDFDLSLNLSSVSGNFYFGLFAGTNQNTTYYMDIEEAWLE